MWMRRRTVRIEMEHVTLRIDGDGMAPHGEPSPVTMPPPRTFLQPAVLDAFLRIRRPNLSVTQTHNVSDREVTK